MEHTKGKWEANLFTTFKGEVIYAIHAYPEATHIKRVAEVFEEANAQLMAAAPDMYEVGVDIAKYLLHEIDPKSRKLYVRLCSALAKVEGSHE